MQNRVRETKFLSEYKLADDKNAHVEFCLNC